MDSYIISMILIGAAGLAASWLPTLTQRLRISYSIPFMLIGFALYSVLDVLPWPSPEFEGKMTLHLTELVVIVALMGTGLKIDRRFRFREWQVPFRLLSITMLLCIGTLALMGVWWLGLSLASAVLLGAALAPTDPVLASDVQVDPPNKGHDDDTRFTLTAEAGLNDGLAFPFVWLAIALAIPAMSAESDWLLRWLAYDVLYRIGAGLAIGYGLGRLLSHLFFTLAERHTMPKVRDGMMAICATLLVYGVTELAHGYGFIAVFIAAITLRNQEMKHRYHTKLHDFTEQVERMLLVILLMLFGGMLATGILDPLTWPMALVGIIFVLVVRPVAGMLALWGSDIPMSRRAAISFFGIRGVGSFFYIAFALDKAEFADADMLWALASFIVLFSITIHGLTAPTVIARLRKAG